MNKVIQFCFLLLLLIAVSCKNNGSDASETFSLQSTITPANAGSVSPSGGSFDSGEQVQITATPNDNFIFKEWNGDISGSDNPASITIDKNMSINALFEKLTYPLTVEIEGEGEVSEQIVNAKTDYAAGTTVELTAEPKNEWRFVNWTGDLESEENPTTITMDQDKNITALFEFGYNEDFEDGKAQNWTFSDDRFSVTDGKLRFSAGRDDNWAGGVYDQIFSDFKMEVQVARTRSQATIDYTLAMFLRVNGDASESLLINGYMVGITQGGYGAVFKYEDSVETQFSPWVKLSELNDDLGEYNVVTVNAVGAVFEIFINGKYIITITDDTFSEGYTGIGTYASDNGENRVLWEYVKVTEADPLRNKTRSDYDTSNTSVSVEGTSKGTR